MKTNTKTPLKIAHILSWILFIGLCIQTGAFLFSYSEGAKNINLDLNLSELYQNSSLYYSILIFILVLISGLKAYLFCFVIKIFLKLNFTHPFSNEVLLWITNISYTALAIGTITILTEKYCNFLIILKAYLPLLGLEKYIGGSSEFLFMAAIIFIIAQIFKRRIEIQSENELTL